MKSIPISLGSYMNYFGGHSFCRPLCFNPDYLNDTQCGNRSRYRMHLSTGSGWLSMARSGYRSFSLYGQGKPWSLIAGFLSWCFMGWFRHLAWPGLLIYTAVLSLGITSALLMLIRKIEQNAGIAIGLTALGFLQWRRYFRRRPWLLTILLFIIELDILLTPAEPEIIAICFCFLSFLRCGQTSIFSSFTGSLHSGFSDGNPWSNKPSDALFSWQY